MLRRLRLRVAAVVPLADCRGQRPKPCGVRRHGQALAPAARAAKGRGEGWGPVRDADGSWGKRFWRQGCMSIAGGGEPGKLARHEAAAEEEVHRRDSG